MNTTSNKKLCWNCDGNVDKEAVQCVYCGVSLPPSYDEDDNESSTASKTSAAPYPSYSSVTADTASIYGQESTVEAPSKNSTSSLPGIPFALLLSGVVLFVFAVMLLFFSKDGVLNLQWDADYWFVYLLVSLPLLLLGWKLLGSSQEDA